MKPQVLFIGIIIFVFSLCLHASDGKEKIAIFSKEYMNKHYKKSLMPWPYSYWTPELEQVQQIDIIEHLEKNNLIAQTRGLDNYAFQYYGLLVKGRKYLEIQAVCTDTTKREWKHKLYLVKGGGNCFFHLSYDVGTRVLSGFHVNAPR